MTQTPIEQAASQLGGLAQRDAPLGALTTYRVGGNAALFVEVEDESGLIAVKGAVASSRVDVVAIGRGSNLLVSDRGFPGLAVTLGEQFAAIDLTDAGRVRAGAAASLPVVARRTASAGLTGFEWAVGVPGSVGGAVRMNAGGHGSDMASCLIRYRFVDLHGGPDGEADAAQLAYGYRKSTLAPHHLVVAAELQLSPGDAEASGAEIAEIVRWRREHQPGGQNAGSIFTNPDGDSAGRLIEACGLKGFRVGSAHVSTKHANFFQADEGGSANDVHALIEEVRRRVREEAGVDLHPEVRLVGFDL